MGIILSRLLSLFRPRALDARMDEEIAAHIAMQAAEYVRRGMDPDAARYAALREFGGVEIAREDHRASRSFAWIDALQQDLLFCPPDAREVSRIRRLGGADSGIGDRGEYGAVHLL